MRIAGSLELLCVLAVTAAVPLGVNDTRGIDFLDKSDVASPSSRIFNGMPATAGQFPYQVGLIIFTSEGLVECGGTLITNTWVLTAAHCLYGATEVVVVLGSLTKRGDENVERIPGARNVSHEGFDFYNTSGGNDVAVIQLSRPAPINDFIKTITLNRENIGAGNSLIVSGYGAVSDKGRSSDMNLLDNKLMWATVKSISNSECRHFYRVVSDGVICTKGQSNESICSGDSGGPLVLVNGSSVSLVGITSFGDTNSCEQGYPTAFTRISDYYDWIQAAIGSEL